MRFPLRFILVPICFFSFAAHAEKPVLSLKYNEGKIVYLYQNNQIKCGDVVVSQATGCTHAKPVMLFQISQNAHGQDVVYLTLGFDTFLVDLSTRLKKGSCEFDLTLKHELTHVALYRKVMERYKKVIAADILGALGNGPITKESVARAKNAANRSFAAFEKEAERQNALLDGQDHYEYQSRQCWGKQ